jgi:outer membrane protein assembly factor BamB
MESSFANGICCKQLIHAFAWEFSEEGGGQIQLLGDTAGGVLFHGDPNGDFVAVDERDGRLLWHFPTNEVIKASPMTYTVGGAQFIALAVGSNIMCFGLP